MPLPAQECLERTLSSLTLQQPGTDEEWASVVVGHPAIHDHSGREQPASPLTMYHAAATGELTIEALARRVESELRSASHTHSRDAALAVLATFAARPARGSSAVADFNKLVSSFRPTRVLQGVFYPWPPPPPGKPIELGSFRLGPYDPARWRALGRRVRTDYFDLYCHWPADCVLERDVTVPVFRPDRCGALWRRTSPTDPQYRAIDLYYHAVGESLFADLWERLDEEQAVLVAIGAPYLTPALFRDALLSRRVSVFDFDEGGWTAPSSVTGMNVQWGGVGRRVPEFSAALVKHFGFRRLGASEIHQTLRSFARFVVKGESHEVSGRADEGFLHRVIALDLLFGERDGSTRSIGNRVAVATYKRFDASFGEQRKQIEKIYDARSRYVHGGVSVNVEGPLPAQLRRICHEVTLCLLRLSAPASSGPAPDGSQAVTTTEQWHKKLDHLVTGIEAGYATDVRRLDECGIWHEGLQEPSLGNAPALS